MTTKSRSAEEWIPFLLTCMDNTPAKPDWNKVASDTGAYKSGKFANQAYVNLRKKYGLLPTVNSASVPSTPRSSKKRAANEDLGEDDEKPGRSRKPRTPKKEKIEEEDGDVKSEVVKIEDSDDELNSNVTIGGEDDRDDDED